MRKLIIAAILLLAGNIVFAQNTVSGRVTDSSGKPLPGISIKARGNKAGASTNKDGSFALDIPGTTATLDVTGIGYLSKTVVAESGQPVSISLDLEAKQLSEVVVTALGITRTRNSLPYAAQQVTGDDVSKNRSSNFVSNLSGKVSGIEIRQNNTLGASTNVVIRGAKSLLGSNQALFVVDGVPIDNTTTNTANQRQGIVGYDYGSAAADINPDDIESINVLKGAAATALYGSRAGNGVILITTKKASKGLGVTVNTGVSFGSIDKKTFASYQKSYGGGYGQYYEDPSGYFLSRDINGDGIDDLVVPTSEDASYGAPFDAGKQVYLWDAFDPTSPYYGKSRPWVAAANDPTTFFEKPVSTNIGVAVDGGGDKGQFKLGYNRNDDKGILPNSRIKKDLLNFGANYKIVDNLVAGASVNYSKINGLGRYGTGYDPKSPATNFREWWQVNNDIKELKDAYFRTRKNVTWNWADPTDLTPIYWDNPYWDRYENYESDGRDRLFGNVSLAWKINKFFDVLGRIGMDSYDEVQEERINVGSIDVSQYLKRNNSFREYNYDLLINFNKDLSKAFNIKATIGSNIRRSSYKSNEASTNGGLAVPDVYSLSNTKNPMESPLEIENNIGVDGVFLTGTLGFRDQVFLDASVRRDKSSTLPVDNNVYYYPAVSLGWVFSKLIHNTGWLSYGKFRANYAEVGNSAPAHTLEDVYNFNTSFGGVSSTRIPLIKNNPDLKPEKTRSAEAGLEMQFLHNRVGFDITYYDAKSLNQIVAAPVSRATGYDAKYINAGEIENKGIELTLKGTPLKTKNFSWDININWTRNRNRVNSLGGEIDNLELGSFQGGVTINASLGQPYGTIRGNNFVYTDGKKTVDASTGRYLLSATSNEIIGNTNPDWLSGITNTFRYKNIALSFLIDIRKGGDVFSLDMYYGLATGLYPETAGLNDLGNPLRLPIADGGGIIRDGVTPDGKTNTKRAEAYNYGAYGYRYSPAAAFVYDASFVKLRELTLTYSFPQAVISKLKVFKGIDFSIIGRNLWLIHKNLPYADPEEGLSAGNLQGYQVGAYPTTRNMGLNLKLRF